MKFLVTEESGRLARWLRLMGHDVALAGSAPLAELYRRAFGEQRTVVTRNRRIGASCLFRVVQLQSAELETQLRQIVRDLALPVRDDELFTRCGRCNVPVEPIDKAGVKDRIPPYVYETQERFMACPGCHRIYWAATHWQRARDVFARIGPSSPEA